MAIYTDEAVVIQCKVLTTEHTMAVAINLTLLSLCAFYTFKTRKVPKQFRQTREMGVAVYGTATVLLVTLATIWNFDGPHVIRGRVMCTCKPVLSLLVLVPIFFPKIYGVLRHSDEQSATSRVGAERSENFFREGRKTTLEIPRNTGDMKQLDPVNTNSTVSSSESLHRRVVFLTGMSAEVPGLQSAVDPACTGYSAQSNSTNFLEKDTPSSMTCEYSTWL